MIENVENLVLEMLRKVQAEQSASRERDMEILARLSHIESGLADAAPATRPPTTQS